MEELLSSFQKDILNGVEERLQTIRDGLCFPAHDDQGPPPGNMSVAVGSLAPDIPTYNNGSYPAFVYAEDDCEDRKFWQVPKTFVFPKVNRYAGWHFWLLGMPDHQEKQDNGTMAPHPIMPFRLFNHLLLPKAARNCLRINWQPMFKVMDEAIVGGDSAPLQMTSEEVDGLYKSGTALLKIRASYCFANRKNHLWSVATWSKKVSPSFIRKFGTEEDQLANPPPKNNFSRNSRTSKGRKRAFKPLNLHGRRERETRRPPPSLPPPECDDNSDDDYTSAFIIPPLLV